MQGFQRIFVGTFVGVWLAAASAHAVTIKLHYKDTTANPHRDAIRAFTPQEIAIVDEAKTYWESVITSGEIFNIDVVLGNLTMGRLGEARPARGPARFPLVGRSSSTTGPVRRGSSST